MVYPRDEFFTKKPTELFDFDMDFTPDMVGSEIISTWTVKVYDSAGVDKSITMVDSSTKSARQIKAWFKGGTASKSYLAVFEVVTTGGRTLVEEVYIHVREKK
jgi:hypothetical protein